MLGRMVRASRPHPFGDRWNHNSHYYPLLRSLVPDAAREVLDIGCGEGSFCHYVATDTRAATGVDLDVKVLPRSTGQVRFLAASAEELPFQDATFDAVTMTMVLHHLPHTRALWEAARVLVPGGELLVLGGGRFGGPRDVPHEARDLVAHRLHSRNRSFWDPGTVTAEPPMTWRETEEMLRRELRGCLYRRLPMWRYLARWRKPGPVPHPA
ncbi:MAG: class I SAM-dependent methyltransferase [Nocardioidaceae bacterium]